MPYIEDHKFRKLYSSSTKELTSILKRIPKKKMHGHLNYILTKLIVDINPQGYKELNAIIGTLECMKLELYRRMVAPYEDIKIKENGDVYE